MPPTEVLESVFTDLRAILERQRGTLAISDDSGRKFELEAPVGPATLKAWGGKARRPTIPVAWAEIGKSYVSFHLMPLNGMPRTMSGALEARRQGKACFNSSKSEPALFTELEELTARPIGAFREFGFCT
jgi:hypothetical protein